MLAIHESLNLREANLLAAYLSDHGVPVEVRGGAYQAVEGELSNIRGILPKIHVLDEADAPRAKEMVEAYLEMLRTAPAGDPWICPACQEPLEPQFNSCWKCQTARPA